MKIKLDGWKKTASDKHHTTMRNAEGHEIKIFHSKLSPKFRGQLAALPLADGGDVPDTQVPKLESSSGDDGGGSKGGGGGASSLMKLAPMMLAEGGNAQDDRAKDQDLVDSTQNDDLARMIEKESMDKRARGGKINRYAQGGLASDSKDDSPEQIASDAAAQAPQHAQPQSPVTIINNPTPAPNAAPPSAQQGSAPTSADSVPQSAQPQASAQQSAPQGSAASPMPPSVQGGPGAGQVPQDSPMPEYPTLQAPAIPQAAQHAANMEDQVRQTYIQRHMKDTTGFAEDLNNGHISPKSYGEIADRHTLGRIGTMFGMLLGGIGSGLSGQPNALMAMMDKEIDRDLDAQQKSKSNAQNLYNLTSQRVTAEANAGLTNVTSAERVLAQAKVNYQVMALHKMVEMTKRLPPGPQKQAGEQAIALMAGKIRDGEYQMLDKMYAMEQLAGGGSGGGGGDQQQSPGSSAPQTSAQAQEDAFIRKNEAMIKSDDPQMVAIARNSQAKHFPYVNAVANDSIIPGDKELYKNLHQFNGKMEDLQAYMKAHGNVWDNMSPAIRNVANQKAMEAAMLYGNSIPISQTEGARNWLEKQFLEHNPINVIAQKLLGTPKVMKEIQSSNGLRQKELLGKYGIDSSKAQDQSTPTSSSGDSSSGMIERLYKGRTALYDQNKKFIRYK